jgi:GNAT superfamily N-acetyltransferase
MTTRLSDSTKAAIRAMWARRLKVPVSYLERAGSNFLEREESTWVVIVELDGSRVIVAPSFALILLSQLPTDRLFDVDLVALTLAQYSPRPIGSALLLYAEIESNQPMADQSNRIAFEGQIEVVLNKCLASEVEESGLSEMDTRFGEMDSKGDLVALAGYEIWNDTVAQLGVLVDPRQRGRGIGQKVARVAIEDARSKNLVPQWRARIDNVPSIHLAAELGFVQLGRQLALEIRTPTSHS